jgi:hypothetical protein
MRMALDSLLTTKLRSLLTLLAEKIHVGAGSRTRLDGRSELARPAHIPVTLGALSPGRGCGHAEGRAPSFRTTTG